MTGMLLLLLAPACGATARAPSLPALSSRHGAVGALRRSGSSGSILKATPLPSSHSRQFRLSASPSPQQPHPFELSREYDPTASAEYFRARPWLLVGRLARVAAVASRLAAQLLLARLAHPSDDRQEDTQGQLLRRALVALGPTAVKLGQTLSTRPDLVGEELCEELALLQDDVAAFDSNLAREIIEEELGAPPTDLFSHLTDAPVASASLGQVYRGRLRDTGEEVAVKVQRPGALAAISLDIHILRGVLGALRSLARIGQDIRLVADELGNGLYGELDYEREAANMERFAAAHAMLGFVAVPVVVHSRTAQRVLVTHWVDGQSPRALLAAARAEGRGGAAEGRVRAMVNMGVECSLAQLLVSGVMHADPHPGNLLLTADGTLVYLDHGLLSFVQPHHSQAMFSALLHLVLEDYDALVADLDRLDLLKPNTDRVSLATELKTSLTSAATSGSSADPPPPLPSSSPSPPSKTPSLPSSSPPPSPPTPPPPPLSPPLQPLLAAALAGGASPSVLAVSWGQLGGVLLRMALKYRFRLPPYLTLVARSLTTLEGLALQVEPDFKVLHAALPTLGRELLRRAARRGEARALLAALLLEGDGRRGLKPSVLEAATELLARRRREHRAGADASRVTARNGGLHPREVAGLLRVLYCANLASILRQLCSPCAAEVRRAAAAWMVGGKERETARGGPMQRRCRRYCRLGLARLWVQTPLGVVWLLSALAIMGIELIRSWMTAMWDHSRPWQRSNVAMD